METPTMVSHSIPETLQDEVGVFATPQKLLMHHAAYATTRSTETNRTADSETLFQTIRTHVRSMFISPTAQLWRRSGERVGLCRNAASSVAQLTTAVPPGCKMTCYSLFLKADCLLFLEQFWPSRIERNAGVQLDNYISIPFMTESTGH